jgi:hypothetical protein
VIKFLSSRCPVPTLHEVFVRDIVPYAQVAVAMALAQGLVAVLLAVAGVSASPPPTKRSVIHERHNAQHEAECPKRDRLLQEHAFEMRIRMKQRNLHRGYELLMDVSDPNSLPTMEITGTENRLPKCFHHRKKPSKRPKSGLSTRELRRTESPTPPVEDGLSSMQAFLRPRSCSTRISGCMRRWPVDCWL